MAKKIKWSKHATIQLRNIYEYIKEDSIANAKKVRHDIVTKAELTCNHPYRYPKDKEKIGNDGSYRCFVLSNYRISYQVEDTVVSILRIRHTSMDSLRY